MITLYGTASPNVTKILLALEELELLYRIERRDMIRGDGRRPEFLALNPNGKVPVIVDVDHSGEGPITVFESGAILFYLAEKTGRFFPTSGTDRYTVMQWLMLQMSAIGPMFGQAIHFRNHASEDDYATIRYRTEAFRLADVLEHRLAICRYIGGEEYSIADMAIFPWVRALSKFLPSIQLGRATTRWRDVIEARPAAIRALEQADALSRADAESLRSASTDDLDRYYGRGRYGRP